jgi:hypothetical protein
MNLIGTTVNQLFTCSECKDHFMLLFDSCAFDRCNMTLSSYPRLQTWLFFMHDVATRRIALESIEQVGLDLPAIASNNEGGNPVERAAVVNAVRASLWPSTEFCPTCVSHKATHSTEILVTTEDTEYRIWNETLIPDFLWDAYWESKWTFIPPDPPGAPTALPTASAGTTTAHGSNVESAAKETAVAPTEPPATDQKTIAQAGHPQQKDKEDYAGVAAKDKQNSNPETHTPQAQAPHQRDLEQPAQAVKAQAPQEHMLKPATDPIAPRTLQQPKENLASQQVVAPQLQAQQNQRQQQQQQQQQQKPPPPPPQPPQQQQQQQKPPPPPPPPQQQQQQAGHVNPPSVVTAAQQQQQQRPPPPPPPPQQVQQQPAVDSHINPPSVVPKSSSNPDVTTLADRMKSAREAHIEKLMSTTGNSVGGRVPPGAVMHAAPVVEEPPLEPITPIVEESEPSIPEAPSLWPPTINFGDVRDDEHRKIMSKAGADHKRAGDRARDDAEGEKNDNDAVEESETEKKFTSKERLEKLKRAKRLDQEDKLESKLGQKESKMKLKKDKMNTLLLNKNSLGNKGLLSSIADVDDAEAEEIMKSQEYTNGRRKKHGKKRLDSFMSDGGSSNIIDVLFESMDSKMSVFGATGLIILMFILIGGAIFGVYSCFGSQRNLFRGRNGKLKDDHDGYNYYNDDSSHNHGSHSPYRDREHDLFHRGRQPVQPLDMNYGWSHSPVPANANFSSSSSFGNSSMVAGGGNVGYGRSINIHDIEDGYNNSLSRINSSSSFSGGGGGPVGVGGGPVGYHVVHTGGHPLHLPLGQLGQTKIPSPTYSSCHTSPRESNREFFGNDESLLGIDSSGGQQVAALLNNAGYNALMQQRKILSNS